MSKQVKIFLYKVCQVTTTPKSSSQEILTDCTMQNEAFWLRDLLLIKVLLNLYSLTKYQKMVLERGGGLTTEFYNVEGRGDSHIMASFSYAYQEFYPPLPLNFTFPFS